VRYRDGGISAYAIMCRSMAGRYRVWRTAETYSNKKKLGQKKLASAEKPRNTGKSEE